MTRGNKILTLMTVLMVSIAMSAQQWTQLPGSFKHTQRNVLIHGEYLDSALLHANDSAGISIVHIGDSHVKGKAFPNAVESTLRTAFPRMQWAYFGINGAWASRFIEADMINKIAEQKPNLVIVSFGTNESHAPAYNEAQHTEELMKLVVRIEANCPGVRILLTTPPGSYLAKKTGSYRRRRRRRYTYSHSRNETTPRVVDNIVAFANKNHIAAWDIFNIAGGAFYACTNWHESGLMNGDQIHYTPQGYTLQGKLLGEAIIKDYFIRIKSNE